MDKIIVIAEAGVNHNGSLELAKNLVDVASESGADYVKFQTFKAENLVTKYAELANYQVKGLTKPKNQLNMLKTLELSEKSLKKLSLHCKKRKIKFLSTPFDIDSLLFLNSLDMQLIKIASGEITNLPLLRSIGQLKKETIMSTGMSSIGEISQAMEILTSAGLNKSKITLLQCNTEYPTPINDVNLRAMVELGEKFGTKIGYSDHTKGINISIAAAALGAKIIEKHFTLDKSMNGPDHKSSLDAFELKSMILGIREIEFALGSKEKFITKSEMKNLSLVRKSIVAKTNISRGEKFSSENLTTKRPSNGISPMYWDDLIGNVSNANYEPDDQIRYEF